MTDHAQPVVMGNAEPLRLVVRPGDLWCPTIEDINAREYDYVKLHRLSTFLDVGISPFSLGVAFDGTLILPALEEYRNKDRALSVFNRALCQALLGGVYAEAVSPMDVSFGVLQLDGYSRMFEPGPGHAASLHQALRTKHVSAIDAIRLFHPETIEFADLTRAVSAGRDLLLEVPTLAPELLLSGTTFLVRHQWGEALVHLWTSTEQIIEHVWRLRIVEPAAADVQPIEGRGAFLRDHRTWTASTRLEMIYQRGFLDSETYRLLSNTRKARNRFAHDGVTPSGDEAHNAARAFFRLLSLVTKGSANAGALEPILELVVSRERPHLVRGPVAVAPTHWLPLPPLPGDKNWGDKPYEIIEDLRLKPLRPEA